MYCSTVVVVISDEKRTRTESVKHCDARERTVFRENSARSTRRSIIKYTESDYPAGFGRSDRIENCFRYLFSVFFLFS